jgi:hypothetical protein
MAKAVRELAEQDRADNSGDEVALIGGTSSTSRGRTGT